LFDVEAPDETVQIGIARAGRFGEQPRGEVLRRQIQQAGEDLAPGDGQARFALERSGERFTGA
jgi:hypothetical protein